MWTIKKNNSGAFVGYRYWGQRHSECVTSSFTCVEAACVLTQWHVKTAAPMKKCLFSVCF